MTLCEKCQPYADAYNKAADSYAAAVRLHDPDQAVFRQQMAEAQRNLTNCENTCAPLEVPPPQTPPEHSMVVPPSSTMTVASVPATLLGNNWYVGLSGGPSFAPTVTATEFFSDGKDSFPWGSDTGFYFGARVGKQFGNWRAEGQYSWSINPAAATMPTDSKIGGDTQTFGFFGNAIYTPPFVFPVPLTPHIGVGIGALDVSTTVKVNDMKVFDSSGWAPGAQAIGGWTYQLSPRWSFDLDYRYTTTLSDISYKSLTGNKVTAPYYSHNIVLSLDLHFPAAAPPPPPPPAEIPQARQFASLAPVEAEAAAAHRFTLHYDEADTVLTASSVRALHEALDAIEAGQNVRIAIAGCEANTDFADGSPCARHALRLRHLLGRYGVENPDRLLVRG
jgi:opacity protein-like surface antigen